MENLIACCGLDCAKCEARTATLTNDDNLRREVARKWREMNHTDLITPETINCVGCREEGVKFYYCSHLCEIRRCAQARGFQTCRACDEASHCARLNAVVANNAEARMNIFE